MRLADAYDACLFDLDGVLYIGKQAAPGAVDTVAALAGARLGFVTNNASRSPAAVATHLRELGIPAQPDDVVTSAQAIAALMAERLAPQTATFVVGADALRDEVRAAGLGLADDPADADALVMGYNPEWSIRDLQDACIAVQHGAQWFASNDDSTIPNERGIFPGLGSYLALVAAACGDARPVATAGKPHPPLLEMTVGRLACSHPVFVGDRLDTDIRGARAVGLDSLLVIGTGVHHKADLVAAPPADRPTHVAFDVAGLLDRPREATVTGSSATCGDQRVALAERLTVETAPRGRDEQLDALWALAQLAWAHPGADATDALAALDQLP